MASNCYPSIARCSKSLQHWKIGSTLNLIYARPSDCNPTIRLTRRVNDAPRRAEGIVPHCASFLMWIPSIRRDEAFLVSNASKG